MYRKVVAGLLALAAQGIAGAALAQMQPLDSIDPNEMITSLDAEAVDPALAVVTLNAVAEMDEAGNRYVTARASNGLAFEIHFTSCEQELSQDCKAMYMLAMWDAVEADAQDNLDSLASTFQMERPIVSTGFMPDGKPYLLRFVIADYGIQQGNLLSEFSNFIQNATEYHNRMGTNLLEDASSG